MLQEIAVAVYLLTALISGRRKSRIFALKTYLFAMNLDYEQKLIWLNKKNTTSGTRQHCQNIDSKKTLKNYFHPSEEEWKEMPTK